MSTDSFFDFVLEFLEVPEHFALLPHRVDPGVPGEIGPIHRNGLRRVDLCSHSALSGTGFGVVFRIGTLRTRLQSPSP